MEQYLNKNIKDLLAEFPQLGDILARYEIGCTACGVGTCLFKDIVDIHGLSPEKETELMTAIANVIYPGQEVALPRIERKNKPAGGSAKYSPPINELVEEHRLIKRLLGLIPEMLESLDLTTENGKEAVRQGVDFIQSYADKFHHAKEEAILFKYFDENMDIIKTMYAEHETGRAYVRAIKSAVEQQDEAAVAVNLKAYRELLTGHIQKEDDILYRWMDRNLNMNQVGELFARFQAKDQEFGDAPTRYRGLIEKLEQNKDTGRR